MNEKEVEEKLNKLKQEIAIDQEHKAKLRSEFEVKRSHKGYKKYLPAACIGILLFAAVISMIFSPLIKVQAERLKVQNYRTFMELETNTDLSVEEYDGILYIPDIKEGIYTFDGKEKTKLYSGSVSVVKVSPDGSKLAFYEDGSIKVMDLATKAINVVMKSDGKAVYELSSWFDKDSILYTKYIMQEPGSTYYDNYYGEIYRFNVKNLEPSKLADGNDASYIKQNNQLLYQKGDNIVVLDMSNGKESIVDRGTSPTASPDGKAIAYTKIDLFYEVIHEKVKIEKALQNIWIASGIDFADKTMITSNIALEDIDKEEWLKNLTPSDEVQMLSFSGRYCYINPVWSSDSKTIYSIRRDYENHRTVAVKIDLDHKALSARTVVERYLQSMLLGDEDYQNSLAAVESEALNNLKNKNIIDYKIISEGTDQKTAFVDAVLTFWNETKGSMENFQYRFYLSNETGDYYIIDLK